MTDNLHFASLAELGRLIEARQVSPVELTEILLKRIETFEPQLNAFITVTAEIARQQARRAEAEIGAGRYYGPLHGIPFALKDIYNTKGILTSGGSRVCVDNIPLQDATITRLLLDAGSILLGKLATHEFAHGGPSFDVPWPPARNPWQLEHFTGGSSSGSAAALAAGLVPASLGSDTGGSIRGPASFCGLTGLKPTFGLVSRAGVMPNSFTFDHCGPMARSVEDCTILLQAIAGYDPSDPGSARHDIPLYHQSLNSSIKGLRIGALRHYWETELPSHPDLMRAMEAAIEVFRDLGALVEDCEARPVRDFTAVKRVVGESECYAIHEHNLKTRPGDYGHDFLARTLPACLFSSSDYVQASRQHRRILTGMRPLYERYDVLLASGFGPAPRLDGHESINFWRNPGAFTPFNVTAGPALGLPNGFSNGLPLGMQIIGRPFDEATVFRVGHAYQRATDWHTRRPRLDAGTAQPALSPRHNKPFVSSIDAASHSRVESIVARAGLKLDDRQLATIFEAAPYVLEMADRVRESSESMIEPALAFRLTD